MDAHLSSGLAPDGARPGFSPAWMAGVFLTTVFVTGGLWIVFFIATHPLSDLAVILLGDSVKPILASPFFYFLLFRPLALKVFGSVQAEAGNVASGIRNGGAGFSPGWMAAIFLTAVFASGGLWILFYIMAHPMSDAAGTLLGDSLQPILASPVFYVLLFRPLTLKALRRGHPTMDQTSAKRRETMTHLEATAAPHAIDAREAAPEGQLSPVRLWMVLAVSVFLAETLVMAALSLLPALPAPAEDVLDASLLVALLFPVFYFMLFRPLTRTVRRLSALEEARRVNEARLRAMLDNLPFLAWLKDAKGRYLAVNERFAQASGKHSAAEVVGKTSVEACPEWMLDHYYEDDQVVMAQGKQSHFEKQVVEGGEERWLEIYRSPVLDNEGKVLGITGFSRDITARKRSDENLRLTAKIFESSHDYILVTDAELRIISVNPAFTAITGYTAEEVMGKNPRFLSSGKQDKLFYMRMWKSLMDKGYWSGDVWNRKKDGELFAGWLSISVVRDDMGKLTHYVGVTSDVTERRRTEEQLRLTAKVVESSHDSIIITDTEGRIISVNPAFTEITGYTENEVLGKNPRILNSGKQGREFYEEMWRSIITHGFWGGEVWNRRKDGASYAGRLTINALRDQNGRVTHYVGVTSDITEYKMAQERVRHLAYYDQLTGLPNGSLMRERVGQLVALSLRERREFALLFIDLDNFKNVNDSLGHVAGDLLLQTVAGRLRSSVREQDTVARFGGDEFIVVLPGVGAEGAQQVARKIIGQITNSYSVGLHKITITTSVGITLCPQDGDDVDSLLKNAELALYRAKAKGKNDYAFFTPEMNALAFERMTMEHKLRHALLNEELVLYYQPQISLVTRRVIGMEALVRWPNPEFQMISPDQFIPIAEESDLIVELGEWAMHEACRQNRQWQRSGLTPLPVAVNISARQLKNNDLRDTVSAVLKHTGLDAHYLELELTERAVMADVDRTVRVMSDVEALGVRFAVDDFGTGYSSLSYLKHLPLDKLKIDKSFVRDIALDEDDREITNTITQLAHGLRLGVVAEGVETQQQMTILLDQGCDSAQGYLFGRPMPPEDFAAFLRNTKAV